MEMVRVANSMTNPVIAPVINARLLQWCGNLGFVQFYMLRALSMTGG